ncbi:MAG TPA: outer membrane protein assembly factor BamA [Acidobacteriaceae bacterium]|nr:outer membrane protein assembly factor BamA [Acidobacteriaceae bacterium]
MRTCSPGTRLAHAIASAASLPLLLLAPALLSAQAPATPSPAATTSSQTLCEPEVIGQRNIPKESILNRMSSHEGAPYDPAAVERDFNAIWNLGYFETVRIEREDTPACVQLVVYVHEKPHIATIEYQGLNAVTLSDVDERLKKAKVSLTPESQFDETRVMRVVAVLKDLLSEHGHQYAIVTPVYKTIPPSSVGITFKIKEGPTVKVGKIAFDGNNNIPDHTLRDAMHYSKPIGIPHSIFLQNIFPRTFDATKLDDDSHFVEQVYRDRGYFMARTGEPQTTVRDVGGLNWFTLRPSNGKRVDILMPIEEGERYHLGGITFTGVDAKEWNAKALRTVFTQKDGEWFNATLFAKGLNSLRQAYTSRGYVSMVANPVPRRDDAKKLLYLDIDVDQGKQFYVNRIEFSGNTITRDKVIRRELLLQEGEVYSSQRWDISIRRLNQLGYFDVLKSEDDTETRQNADQGTVDLLLKVKEKGKNSISLNGGISGLSGTFIGLAYETNNFLGLGETLSLNANVGDLSRNISLGFDEPYLRNKPISVGAEVFTRKTDYNPSKAYNNSGLSNNQANANNSLLTNYNTSTNGFTLSASDPLKHLWSTRGGQARIGVTYALSRSTVSTFNDSTRNVFQSLAFRSGVAGPNQLSGIITSTISPSFSYSNLDRAVGAHSGRDFNLSVAIAGAGGNVKYIQPVAAFRQYYPMKLLRFNREGRQVLGMRFQFAHVNGFGGEVAPPTNRLYGGGENDIRGFDVRSSSPYTFVPVNVGFDLTNPDGTTVPRDPTNPGLGNIQIPLPIYRLVSIGGDTQFTANIQYQIPIASTVSFNFFTDFGLVGDLQQNQLRQSVDGAAKLASGLYGCTITNPLNLNGTCRGGQQVANFSPLLLSTVPHTNFVPRMSTGAELQVILPIVNAPFRIFYAYNPLRLLEDVPQRLALPDTCTAGQAACFRNLFPAGDIGDYDYQQARQLYGPSYQLREPRKTLRLTVSTTF